MIEPRRPISGDGPVAFAAMADEPSADIHVGDLVRLRTGSGSAFAVVRGGRLGRIVVERCDGKQQGPVVLRDVLEVFKSAGRPAGGPGTDPLRPSAQLKLLP
jgi:hypothetical protein